MSETAPVLAIDDIDIHDILRMIPHRYPFLMIDRVVDVIAHKSATGVKNVSINEHFFQGHFPVRPVMPGVLLIEAMAQTAAVLVVASLGEETEGKLVYFISVDNGRFRKPVIPGDQVRLVVTKTQRRGAVWKFHGDAWVEDILVAEADFAAMIMDA